MPDDNNKQRTCPLDKEIVTKLRVEGHIEDLNNNFKQQANPAPSTIKRRIIGLLGVAITIAGAVATATDFANNVLELSSKLEVPAEAIQPQLEKFKSLRPEFEWQSR